ncbi:DUF6545 domain-containing protein [Kineococcus sp. SYSU DK003]|uniref:DUF6545 domain-containing protein n=1 Tax=Kineococcus sp. SYSU DK003 TaxID=3383124 RepID=UPI003D7C7206
MIVKIASDVALVLSLWFIARAVWAGRRNGTDGEKSLRMLVIIGAGALALMLNINGVAAAVTEHTGWNWLAGLAKHLIALVSLAGGIAATEDLRRARPRHRPPSALRRVRRCTPLLAAAMIGCVAVSSDPYATVAMTEGLGGPAGLVYWSLFLAFFFTTCVPFTTTWLNFRAHHPEPSDRRAGLNFLAVGTIAGSVYAVCKLVMVADLAGDYLPRLADAATNIAVLVIAVAMSYGCWRSRFTPQHGWFATLTAATADLTRARHLRPITTALRKAAPNAGVGLTVLSPDLVLSTRETTMRDAITDLRDWIDPSDATAVRAALSRLRDDDALIAAAVLELARRRRLDGAAPLHSRHSTPRHDDRAMLQRLASSWPDALDLADAAETDQTASGLSRRASTP